MASTSSRREVVSGRIRTGSPRRARALMEARLPRVRRASIDGRRRAWIGLALQAEVAVTQLRDGGAERCRAQEGSSQVQHPLLQRLGGRGDGDVSTRFFPQPLEKGVVRNDLG